MKKTILATALLTASCMSYADYQFEAGALIGQGEVEAGNNSVDTDSYGIGGEFHFQQVDTSKGPLAEAAFLDKSSFVDFLYTSTELDVPGADDTDTFGFGGRFVTATNLIIEADYSEADDGTNDSDSVRAGIGTYLNETTDVVVSYQADSEDGGDDVDTLNAAVHGVNALMQGASLAYDASLSYIDTDDDDGFGIDVGATYYFNNAQGIGVTAGVAEIGDIETDSFTLEGSYFPMPELELAAWYFNDNTDDGNVDFESDGFMFGAAFRF